MEGRRLDARLIDRLAGEVLDAAGVDPDPIVQFRKWYGQVQRAGIFRADAMVLSTAGPGGMPSGRFVLYKEPEELGIGAGGFPFFTSYLSAKSLEIRENPQVALTFYWKEGGRQVRAQGRAERLAEEVSDRYFRSRPPGSQLGAWASPQSQAIPGRDALEEWVEEKRKEFGTGPVPRPPQWGGFVVIPSAVEFWQHRDDRLHDRIRYARRQDETWEIQRLAP